MDLPDKDNIQSIENALFIEHNVQRIITQQKINGVYFNSSRARFYIYVLKEKQLRLYQSIRPLLSLEVEQPYGVPVRKPFKADGSYSSQVAKWYDTENIPDIGGQFTRVQFVEPDLGKRNKLIAQLLRQGWNPRSFTEKGSPKLTVDGEPCPSLLRIDGEVGKSIAEWYTYRHRESQITGLLKHVREDGRIPADAITIGTPTYRFRHKIVVNIPKAVKQVLFGREMRSLFRAENYKTHRFVGHDASGLELRILAHYINDSDYTREVTSGDIHTKNQRDSGVPTRDDAKTFIYAFIYGAGDAKIGSIVGGSRLVGKRIKQKFLTSNPRLAKVIADSKRAAKRGYLIGLDGRKINLRRDRVTGLIQDHKALNTLLQAGGATVMKWAMVILDLWVQDANPNIKKVIDMHDEGQAEVPLESISQYRFLAEESIRQAGRLLDLNCPLDAESKVGLNWAHTH